MTSRWLHKETLLGAAVTVLALSLALSFYRAFDERMLREQDYRGNPVWVTTQAEHALSQLGVALHRFTDSDHPFSADDVRLEFDLLWSRVDLLKKESAAPLLAETPEVAAVVAAISKMMGRVEKDIAALRPGETEKVLRLLAEVDRMAPEMRKASIAVNVANRLHYAEARSRVRGELAMAVVLALGVLLAGGVLLVVAIRETRASRRLATQYADAMRDLTQARDELEFRVAERTQALSDEVAEHRRTEAELRESEVRYRRVVESIPDALWILRNGIVVLANQACARFFGVKSPDELIGRNALEFIHADDLVLVRRRIADALDAGAVAPREIRMLRVDGGVVPAEAVAIATTYQGEAVVMSVLRDLSERKAAEAEVRLGEARLQQALETSGDGVWDWNVATGTVRRSPRSAEIMGLDPDELGDRLEDWNDRIHSDDRVPHDRAIGACLDGLTPAMRVEYRVRARDGGWVWVLSQGKVVERDAHGRPLRMVGSIRDMTERRRAEDDLRALKEQAESANAAKNKFLANMSHELRTPLNAILGFTEAMRLNLAGPIDNPVYQGYIDDIHDSGTHLLELIADLLDISAIESGAFRLNEAIIDIPTLMAGCLRLLRPKADAAGVRLDDGGFDAGGEAVAPALRADERRARQILLNAVASALRRTPEGGRVALAARLDADGSLVFEIADDGAALSAVEVARALDMQGPALGEPGRVPGGPGLGLPLGRTLVEAHGGTLTLLGAEGHGNATTIRFPAARVLRRDGRQGAVLRVV